MAIPNPRPRTPPDPAPDWRDAWGSEADITTAAPQRAASPADICAPTPDAIASALDEFLPEAPPPPEPSAAPRWEPLRVAVPVAPSVRRPQITRARQITRPLAVAAAAAVLLATLAVGFRESPAPGTGSEIATAPSAVVPAPPAEDSAARLVAARSPQVGAANSQGAVTGRSGAANLQVGRTRGGAADLQEGGADLRRGAGNLPVGGARGSGRQAAREPARTPRPDPLPAAAERRTVPAAAPPAPTAPSSIARQGGAPINGGALSRATVPALDISAPSSVPPAAAAGDDTAAANRPVAPPPGPTPTLASPPATPPVAPPPAPAPPAPPTDRQAINAVLGQYQAAYSRLDTNAVRAIWPGLNVSSLERAFGQVERQAVTFSTCSVAIIGAGATARCQGSASYVPKVGNRTERVDHRQWQIELRKSGDNWRIVNVDSRE